MRKEEISIACDCDCDESDGLFLYFPLITERHWGRGANLVQSSGTSLFIISFVLFPSNIFLLYV